MRTPFAEDVIPFTNLKVNPSQLVKRVTESHRPVPLIRRGRGVAVVQSVTDYEAGLAVA